MKVLEALAYIGGSTILGIQSADGISNSYLGLPFAQPPIGDLRFKLPLPPGPLPAFFNATQFGPACHCNYKFSTSTDKVIDFVGLGTTFRSDVSEDCLTLNVFTPTTGAKNLPVFVYIFGGAFIGGGSSESKYDGRAMIARTPDVIVVTINYRNNAFGWLSSSQMYKENNGFLNPGLQDQKLALEWIKANIASFGGDPDRVTAAGNSAGAFGLGQHLLANDGTQSLFSRVILMSGGPQFNNPTFDNPMRQGAFDKLAGRVGCPTDGDVVGCLRKVDAHALFLASVNLTWGTTADKYVGMKSMDALNQGRFSKIPLLVASVRDEGTLFSFPAVVTRNQSRTAILAISPIFEDRPDALLKLYPIGNYPLLEPWRQYSAMFGDLVFQCTELKLAEAYRNAGLEVYGTRFNHFDRRTDRFLRVSRVLFGVYHTSDVPFLWLYKDFVSGKKEDKLANDLHDSFMNFAKGSKPFKDNNDGGYKLYDYETGQYVDTGDLQAKCDFIAKSSVDFRAKFTPAEYLTY